jgi:mRNA-degrading endonuclease HigB of HigAB toxin-antitoxin module
MKGDELPPRKKMQNTRRHDHAEQYQAGVLAIRFFGSHAEYDKIDAESV